MAKANSEKVTVPLAPGRVTTSVGNVLKDIKKKNRVGIQLVNFTIKDDESAVDLEYQADEDGDQ